MVPVVGGVVDEGAVIFDRHTFGGGAFARTAVAAIHAYARAGHDVEVGIKRAGGEISIAEGMVLGIVAEMDVAAIGFRAVAAGDGIADEFNLQAGALGSGEELGIVAGDGESAEFGVLLVALDGVGHAQRVGAIGE